MLLRIRLNLGLLSLVFVTVVITDADVVRAIGSMCPLLQRADFVTSSTRFDITISHSRYKKNQANVFRRQLHPQEFQSFVNGWPKVRAICYYDLNKILILSFDSQVERDQPSEFGFCIYESSFQRFRGEFEKSSSHGLSKHRHASHGVVLSST